MATKSVKTMEEKAVYLRTFSEDFKRKRVQELEKNLVSVSDICKTFDVNCSSVYRWIYKYSSMAKKGVRQVVESKSDTLRIKQLESKVRDLERIIGQKQVLIEFQDKMIEIAEKSYNVDIKKKLGSKPPAGSGNSGGKNTSTK